MPGLGRRCSPVADINIVPRHRCAETISSQLRRRWNQVLRSIREVKQDWRPGRKVKDEGVSRRNTMRLRRSPAPSGQQRRLLLGRPLARKNDIVWSRRRDWTTTACLSRNWLEIWYVLLTGFRVSPPAVLPCRCYCHTAFAPQIMCHANVEMCCCLSPATRIVNRRFIGRTQRINGSCWPGVSL